MLKSNYVAERRLQKRAFDFCATYNEDIVRKQGYVVYAMYGNSNRTRMLYSDPVAIGNENQKLRRKYGFCVMYCVRVIPKAGARP